LWPDRGRTDCVLCTPFLRQNTAPSPAPSTAAWMEAPGSTSIAPGGQAASVTPAAVAGQLAVHRVKSAGAYKKPRVPSDRISSQSGPAKLTFIARTPTSDIRCQSEPDKS